VRTRGTLVPLLAERLRTRPRGAWLAELREAGVPATPVATLPEALADPQARARGLVVEGRHPGVGPLKMVGSPLWHVRGPDGVDAALRPPEGSSPVPPLLGEHSRAVLADDLGMSREAIDAWVADGVVRVPPTQR
jgi:crotonobetainyl-CoA:carnitine CoA-transferase CaiB-like acyl-CoA transferase